MLKGKTKSGFEFSIDESAQNDMELLDLLSEMDDGKATVMPKVATKLFGKEQKRRLYDHLRTKEGNVPIDVFMEEVSEIFAIIGGEKNS